MKSPQILHTVIPAVLNRLADNAMFMAIKGYHDNWGGISNFGIVFHVDYIKAVKKSLAIWYAYEPKDDYEKAARIDLINSYTETLSGHNSRATSAHAYRRITDGKQLIKSIKWHDRGAAVHFWGFRVNKLIIKPPEYPVVHSHPFTIARRRLVGMAPIHRFRQFKIYFDRFDSIGVEKLTLTEKDLIKELV